jgi:hypothetical protein
MFVAVGVGVLVSRMVPVEVVNKVAVNVGEMGMMIAGIAVGINGGVGERIVGNGDGHITEVEMARGIYPPLHADSRRSNTIMRIILVILFLHRFDSNGNSD